MVVLLICLGVVAGEFDPLQPTIPCADGRQTCAVERHVASGAAEPSFAGVSEIIYDSTERSGCEGEWDVAIRAPGVQ
jgi:hypothetical protein